MHLKGLTQELVETGELLSGKQICRKKVGCPSGYQSECESAVQPGSKENKPHPGLYCQKCSNWVKGGYIPLFSALVRHTWSAGSSAGLCILRETWSYWNESSGSPLVRGLEHMAHKEW